MGTIFQSLDSDLQKFIREQRVFFIASAPLAQAGHVNLSPKGLDSFRILGPEQVAYVDFVGSGIETVSHLRENGRIVIMFCAFEGRPRILRLHGRGRCVEPHDEEWEQLAKAFPSYAGARSIIVVDVMRIADSCGYGIPLYHYSEERTQLSAWAERKGEGGLRDYEQEHNLCSIDGLPGLRTIQAPRGRPR